jgi:phosphomannomutase
VGALLAADLLATTGSSPERLIATTIVSSRLVPAMCAAAGVHHVETLTGFKWLCRPGMAHPQWRQLLLYEEALGYAVGREARDKDGITAALAVLAAVGGWRLQGRSAWDVLDDLARRHGAHVTLNGSVRLEGHPSDPAGLLDPLPAELDGRLVVVSDRPATGITRLVLADDTRVIIRPSGTEPKVKYYVEAIEPVSGPEGDRAGVERARAAAAERLTPIVAELEARLLGRVG